ncbi:MULTISPECIES: Gfo/Idh/MocA family protein [Enterococcus]|uniref:Gfo/Idh/MocA family protein n=1 Tax=Enterococcus TaxID=1350 RepID=UPI0010F6C9FB|nr:MULTISPECIES: Gfo/Idh/MocA family oxidoreductase [Enterococcus]KAF1300786.1 oxidoreductase [Enterococcus sp. JM9B]
MKIGVIGLGNIAQKAYLPTYVKVQNQGEFYFATRNPQVQKEIKEKYHLANMVGTLEELLAVGIEAIFIHTATSSHYAIAKKCLEQGIHVFMDKPASERVTEVAELQQIAADKKCFLMIGFNRRFAPMVQKLKEIPDKRLILLQKNRVSAKESTAFVIYDLFLHVIDTAVYLLDGPIHQVSSRIRETDGFLETATLQLETADSTALLTMDLRSGANTELYQVTSPQATHLLTDLTNLQTFSTQQTLTTFGDWETTLYKRGFEQLVESFIEGIKTTNFAIMRQENVFLSHELCQQMLQEHERHLL